MGLGTLLQIEERLVFIINLSLTQTTCSRAHLSTGGPCRLKFYLPGLHRLHDLRRPVCITSTSLVSRPGLHRLPPCLHCLPGLRRPACIVSSWIPAHFLADFPYSLAPLPLTSQFPSPYIPWCISTSPLPDEDREIESSPAQFVSYIFFCYYYHVRPRVPLCRHDEG